jgi:hypothetical protein
LREYQESHRDMPTGTGCCAATTVVDDVNEGGKVQNMPDGPWVMDTGCGHDLISEKLARGFGTLVAREEGRKRKIVFNTANGRIATSTVVPMNCEILDAVVTPFVLPDTPSVLSIGYRCMELGYSFHWKAGKNPVLVTPGGKVVCLAVEKNVPLLRVGEPDMKAEVPKEFENVPVAAGVEEDEGVGPAPAVVPAPAEPEMGDADEDSRALPRAHQLELDAKSRTHKLTHLPKNPRCESCVRGKMKEKYSRRGAFRRQLTKWGELITFDHMYSGSHKAIGMKGEKEALVIKDVFTGMLHVYPVMSRWSGWVISSLQEFTGTRKVHMIYSDNAPEFVLSAKTLGIPHSTSTPGVSHTNAIIERSTSDWRSHDLPD